MNTLIKSADDHLGPDIRAIRWPAPTPEDAPAPPSLLERLEAEIEALKADLADAAASRAAAIDQARAEARLEAARAHVRDDARMLDALRKGMGNATHAFTDYLRQSEALALLLCETALEKVFGDPTIQRDLIARAIHVQVDGVNGEAVLRLSVSAADFPNEGSLSALQLDRLLTVRDPTLAAGECRIGMRFGEIELSLPEHWDALKALLRNMAENVR